MRKIAFGPLRAVGYTQTLQLSGAGQWDRTVIRELHVAVNAWRVSPLRRIAPNLLAV